METFSLYLADIIPNIRILSIILAVLSFIFLMGILAYKSELESDEKDIALVEKALLFAITCFVAVSLLLPSKEFIHMLYGM